MILSLIIIGVIIFVVFVAMMIELAKTALKVKGTQHNYMGSFIGGTGWIFVLFTVLTFVIGYELGVKEGHIRMYRETPTYKMEIKEKDETIYDNRGNVIESKQKRDTIYKNN